MNRANSHNSYIVSFQNDETSELLKFGQDIWGKEMSYSNFSLKDVKNQLGVSLIENNNLFSDVEDVEISQILRDWSARKNYWHFISNGWTEGLVKLRGTQQSNPRLSHKQLL